jgi:5-methylcytosine-specific restriction endonuclease McrA
MPLLPGQRLHVDHIIPTSRGGTDHPSNLRVVHGRCNLRKGNRMAPRVYAASRDW